jgi:aspartate aminotransferase
MGKISAHFQSRKPSAIRLAQIEFMKRKDHIKNINTAIGNVSLPMHPAMQERMFNLSSEKSPFKEGIVKYSATIGLEETNKAFLNIIASSGFKTEGLYSQITEGGSQAMELVILGVCGPAGSEEQPLLLIEATYTNYRAMAQRVGRKTISVRRHLEEHGKFSLPELNKIEEKIKKHKPGAMLVIPYDNPTGHFLDHKTLVELGKLCVKSNMWMISDEAYRELHYVDQAASSIWGLTNKEVPGIEGRRISIETASKVWNACGLRIGALVTDNKEFHEKAVAENTANLCPNVIGQYIFGALAHVRHEDLKKWYHKQREYYKKMMKEFTDDLKNKLPGIIISSPDASIYSVVDVRKIAKPGFNALDFVLWCSQKGKVKVKGKEMTLLVSPMAEFYNVE